MWSNVSVKTPCGISLQAFLSATQIQDRVAALGKQLTRDYANVAELRLIGILKGAWIFLADLVRHIDLPVTCDFIGVSSYGERTTQTGIVRLTLDLAEPIADLDVVLVEDIIDTGLTMCFLHETLSLRRPRAIRTCTLLDKPSRRHVPFVPDYVGFTIPNHFVVGYGLDLAGAYRNLPDIAICHTPDDSGETAL
jgi:hypoxanthine phosphoribosyltransferase